MGETVTAALRTILGDDPHTIEDETPAPIRDDVTSAVCVEGQRRMVVVIRGLRSLVPATTAGAPDDGGEARPTG